MDFKVGDRISYTGDRWGEDRVDELGVVIEVNYSNYMIRFDNPVGMWSDSRLGIPKDCGLYINKDDEGLKLMERSNKVSNVMSMQVKLELDEESVAEIYNTINELQEKLNNLKLKLKF